jgi:hypothetical protein
VNCAEIYFIFILLPEFERPVSKLYCAQIVVCAVLGQNCHAARVYAVFISVVMFCNCWTSYTVRCSCSGSETGDTADCQGLRGSDVSRC